MSKFDIEITFTHLVRTAPWIWVLSKVYANCQHPKCHGRHKVIVMLSVHKQKGECPAQGNQKEEYTPALQGIGFLRFHSQNNEYYYRYDHLFENLNNTVQSVTSLFSLSKKCRTQLSLKVLREELFKYGLI